jgi:hypothetical protein
MTDADKWNTFYADDKKEIAKYQEKLLKKQLELENLKIENQRKMMGYGTSIPMMQRMKNAASSNWQDFKGRTLGGKVGYVGGATMNATAYLGRKTIKGGSFLARKTAVSKESIPFFFIVALLIHTMDAATGFSRGYEFVGGFFLLYFVLALWAVLGIFKPDGGFIDKYYLGVAVICSLISLMVPRISGALSLILPQKVAYMFVVFAPAWIIYFMFFEPNSPKWIKILGSLYFTFWVLLIAMNYATSVDSNVLANVFVGDRVNTFTAIKETGKIVQETTNNWKEKFGLMWAPLYKSINQTWSMTQPDYYTAEVDENAKRDLGVTINKIKATSEKFLEGEDVSAFITVEAQSIDSDIELIFSCIADKGKKDAEIKDSPLISIYPERITLFDNGIEDVDCTVKKGTLKKGTHTITMGATFDFSTQAYIKSYFVDYEKYKNFAREDMDFLKANGIEDTEPVAIYTKGPLEVGIGVRDPLVKIDRASLDQFEKVLNFGVSLKNDWASGEIVMINDVTLVFPAGFKLSEDEPCTGGMTFKKVYCKDFDIKQGCSDSTSTLYRLTAATRGFDKDKSVRCKLILPSENYDKILGERPLTTLYFKALVNYTYKAEKTVSVNVITEEESIQK